MKFDPASVIPPNVLDQLVTVDELFEKTVCLAARRAPSGAVTII